MFLFNFLLDTLSVLQIKVKNVEPVVKGGRVRNRGHKEEAQDSRRSIPGGCNTRLKVPGVQPPEQPAPCSHWPLLCEAHTAPVTLLGCDLEPHDLTSQRETTSSCQAVMFMLSAAVGSSLKTQVRWIALVICSFPQPSYH